MEKNKFHDEKHERFLSYNGEVLAFQISPTKGGSGMSEKTASLDFRRTNFQTVSGKFIETSTGQYSFSTGRSSNELVCVSCVADSRTGVNLPCILLRTSKKKNSGISKCTLLMLHSSNELECCLTFKLDTETVHDLQMCDGPTVLWRHHDKLLYVSPQTSGVVTAPVNVTSIQWSGEIEGEGITVFGIRNTSFLEEGKGPNTFSLDGTLQGSEFVAYSIGTQQTVPATCFLPHAYSSIIRCLQVYMMQVENGKYETSVVAASNKQLIWFHNGVPKEVCQLPFENPFKLQVASTSRGDLLFIVSFATGDVCAIWKDSWQITATWQRVRSVLVDDFVGTGSEQMLLLFKDDPINSAGLQIFKITDCSEINFAAGLLSLQELKKHLQVKDRVLNSSCEALTHMVQGNKPTLYSEEEEGLVSLWDDDDLENSAYPSASEIGSSAEEYFVEKVWQRVVDDLLVIGVKLNNSAYLSLSNMGLSLIMDQEIASISPVTKCHTNVLKLTKNLSLVSSAACQTGPVIKKRRLCCHSKDNISRDCSGRPCSPSFQSNLEHTVTAVTELSPLLALYNTSCVLLLHARRKHQPDCLHKSERLTIPCGRMSLSLEDVLKGKHTVNVFEHCQVGGNSEDVFAVLAAFQKCCFHIYSPDCTLASVKVWLMGQMQGKPVQQFPEIIFCGRPGSLQGTLFIWNPKTPCEGTLTVFYRNQAVLIQCLYSLKSVLPPTCVVNIIRLGNKDSLTENLALSLEEELLALRSSLSSAASEVEKELTPRCKSKKKTSNTIGSLSDTRDRVQKYREELQIEQKQSKLGAHLTTNSNLYRQNTLNIAHIQMNSDRIAQRLAKL
ncbi:hypothetical protein FKM82_008264 [Ascaphus truei]